jgi:molybdate transport system substrate-binding protein
MIGHAIRRILGVAVLGIGLAAASTVAAQSITVSAAISTKDAVSELGRGFVASHPGVTLFYNWGSSGDLQKQIEAGAPVDLFIAAAALQMDELEKRKLVVPGTRRLFARNLLTVIKPADSRVDIVKPGDLVEARVGRIVVGNPRTVPAGQYAEESLRALGLWDRLQPKLVFAENVRQALEYVARGEVDAGFVYTTDAAARGRAVKEAFRPAEDTYRPVVYPVAVVVGTRQPALAAAFIELLLSREGQAVLSRHGFEPPPAGAR